jgi:multiple antibiotic resistance protein
MDLPMNENTFPLALLGSLLFTLMGPIAMLPLFAGTTAGADPALRRKIALLAFVIAVGVLSLAVLVGSAVMKGSGTSPASLIIAAGFILLATALKNLLGEPAAASRERPPVTLATALTPLAIPGIVTPVGVAVLIIFVSYFPAIEQQFAILGAVIGVMAINLVAMLASHAFMKKVGPSPLVILGAVFGVLQAAMGFQFIINGLMLTPLFKE